MADNTLNLIKGWLLKPQAYKPWVVSVIAIIVLASLVLWLAALFFVYLADDWNSTRRRAEHSGSEDLLSVSEGSRRLGLE